MQAVIPVLRNGKWEDQYFKASPTYIKNLGLAWDMKRFYQKKKLIRSVSHRLSDGLHSISILKTPSEFPAAPEVSAVLRSMCSQVSMKKPLLNQNSRE